MTVSACRRCLLPHLVLGVTLLGLAAVTPAAHAASPPGANGRIVYGQVFPNYGVTINPDGSDAQQVGPADSTTCNTWSPDSSKVLCNLWSPDGVPQPATADPDGSNFTLLDQNLPLDLFCLNWSPDGARLLCHSEGIANPGDAGLYTVRSSDAGDLVRVTTTPPDGPTDVGYGYSPDGSRILYARFGSGKLVSVSTDGSDPIQLTPADVHVIDLGFFDRVGADWSPDGSQVAFAAFSHRHLGLFVVDADGTGFREVTPPGLGAISAQWSPDGRMIAFTSCCGRPEAWIVHPDGTGLRPVTNPVGGAAFFTPAWSPDSTKLLVNEVTGLAGRAATQLVFGGDNVPASIWTVNVDGTQPTWLADAPALSLFEWGSAVTG